MNESENTGFRLAGSVEHVIGYAYPSSPLAVQLGYSKSGCFTVEVAGKTTPAKSYGDAKASVGRLGTVPGRWSWDHPCNSHLRVQPSEVQGARSPVTV